MNWINTFIYSFNEEHTLTHKHTQSHAFQHIFKTSFIVVEEGILFILTYLLFKPSEEVLFQIQAFFRIVLNQL